MKVAMNTSTSKEVSLKMSPRIKVPRLKVPKFVQRIGRFLKEVRLELKKVIWPNRKELVSYTSIVIVTVLVVAVFIGAIDSLFASLLRLFIEGR